MPHNDFVVTMKLSYLLSADIGINGDEATIIDTIYCSKKAITDNNIGTTISELFHVHVEQNRIDSTIRRLIKVNKLYRIDNILLISPQTLEDINSVIVRNEQCERSALKEWIKQYQHAIGTELPQEKVELIQQSILHFVRTFFLTHGADCYGLIIGAKQSTCYDVATIAANSARQSESNGTDSLTRFLEGIFSSELSEVQKSFLLAQLKKAVHYLSMVVDNNTQSTLVRQLDDVTIYLDTTILYRLLNLQGERRFLAIRSLVTFCQDAKVTLKVFQATVAEMKRRIDYDAHVIIKHPTPVNFASIGYRCRSTENYISTFWKEQSETGVSAKDFNFRYSNILALPKELDIEVDEQDYINEFNLEQKRINFRNKVVQFDSTDPEYQKSSNAISHDAECLANIEYLQISNASSVIEAKTFFLSSDWSLVRLQRYDHEYKNKTDMVVLPSQLMQIFCMTAPTNDYYEAFLGLFSSSRTFFGTNSLSNEQIQEILGRVAMYKGTTPSFAERILANQLIQSTFTKKETDEEKNELIDDIMISEVEQMEEDIETKEEALKSKERLIEQVRTDNSDKESRINDLSSRIMTLEEKHNATAEELGEANIKITTYEQYFEVQAGKKSKRKTILRLGSGWILIAVGVIGILLCIAALIPITSPIVAPCFKWLGSSSVIKDAQGSPIEIIGVLAALAIASISAGYICIKPGYTKLLGSYFDEYVKVPVANPTINP